MNISNIYILLGIATKDLSEEKMLKKIEERKEKLDRLSDHNMGFGVNVIVNKHYELIKRIGLAEYDKRVKIQNRFYKENGTNIDIFNDDFFEEIKLNFDINDSINIFRERELERFEQSQNIKPKKTDSNIKNGKKFKIHKTSRKKTTKNFSAFPLKKVFIATGVSIGVLSVFAIALLSNGDLIDKSSKVNNITTQQAMTNSWEDKENLIPIEYKVISGDTKTKIINKLELSEEEAQKIPVNIYIDQTYKLKVKEEIADSYNYEYKTTQKKVFSYELPSGGSLFDIASYAKEEYPELFGNLSLNKIVSQIASDNGYTPSDYNAGTYTIYFHASQKEIDELTNEGLLPNLNNSMHTN